MYMKYYKNEDIITVDEDTEKVFVNGRATGQHEDDFIINIPNGLIIIWNKSDRGKIFKESETEKIETWRSTR